MFDTENQSEEGFQYGRLSCCLPWVVGKGRYFRRVILLSVFSTNETNEQTLLLLDHACLSRWQQREEEAKPSKMKTSFYSILPVNSCFLMVLCSSKDISVGRAQLCFGSIVLQDWRNKFHQWINEKGRRRPPKKTHCRYLNKCLVTNVIIPQSKWINYALQIQLISHHDIMSRKVSVSLQFYRRHIGCRRRMLWNVPTAIST